MYKFQFFPLHCPSRNAISSKVFNEFSKTFFWLKDEEGGYCGWKFQVHRYFGFAIATLQTFPTSRKCKNFNFSLYTVPAEMLYLQKYLTNFQKLFLAERWGRWLLWLKISSAQIFWFCNSNVTTFPTSRKISIFPFTLSQQRIISKSAKTTMRKVAIVLKISIAHATLQLFQHPENVKISIFPFTLSQQKCYIFKSI